MSPSEHRCRLCRSPGRGAFDALEMLYGTRESFRYFECSRCGCIQISEIPATLGTFYPTTYYSFHADASPLRTVVRRLVLRGLFAGGVTTRMLRRALGGFSARLSTLSLYEEASRRDHGVCILDVGSGAGSLVRSLRDIGFARAVGIDPFINADVHDRTGVLVRRLSLAEVDGRFDVISFHHSLEHMPDQHEALAHARRLLGSGGKVIVRIPVADCDAWRTYGEHWVQLDAPRHLYLHTRCSLELVARGAGLRVADVRDDSTEFQYWGSELYRRGVPLSDARLARFGPKAFFDANELATFRRRADAANAASRGDQIVAFLEASD